jgi:hypothetical protein
MPEINVTSLKGADVIKMRAGSACTFLLEVTICLCMEG